MDTELRARLQETLGAAFTLERELGGGGMSRVFVAEETRLRRKVVVKVLSPDLAAGLNISRFEREIQMAASLQHANIVPVLSAGDSAGLPFYTMPYVDGQSLRSRLATGALPVGEVVSILKDVSRALAYAHAHGVVHRDIKPDNVLLSGGAAVVTDFGIAKALSVSRTTEAGTTLTQMGVSIGTPAYMSPEQAAGESNVDHRADIYALGCMAFELLTGRTPFVQRTAQKMLAAHMGEIPEQVSALRPETPPILADAVMRCLAKDANDRPQDTLEFARVLDTVTSGSGMQAMPSILLGGTGMFRRALLIYAIALGAVFVLTKAAIVGIGLPDWVLPGALIVMAALLPVILFTGYTHYVTRRALTMTPTLTPGGTSVPAVPQGTMATIAVKASPHMSWRRTLQVGVYGIGGFALLVGAAMAMRVMGIGPFATLLSSGAVAANPYLLVTDFSMRGGSDTTLGGVVSEAIRAQLNDSRAFKIVPRRSVMAALQVLGRAPSSRIDLALGREMAQRGRIAIIVDGDLTPLGAGYIVTARLHAATDGRELASFRETAATATDLIPAVDRTTRALRAKLGESLRDVHAAPDLAWVTTGSIEALKKYQEGQRALTAVERNLPAAISAFSEAIAIDSTFADAYANLALALNNAGIQPERRDSLIDHAFRLRSRLPEGERLWVEGNYYRSVHLDRRKAIEAFRKGSELDDSTSARGFANSMGVVLDNIRDYARAESVYASLLDIKPPFALPHQNIVWVQVAQGHLEAASLSVQRYRQKFPSAHVGRGGAAWLAYARGWMDSVAIIERQARESAPLRRGATWFLANLAELQGQTRESDRLRTEALVLDSTAGEPVQPFGVALFYASREIVVRGNVAKGLERLDEATRSSPLSKEPVRRQRHLQLASLYAMAGAPQKARAVMAQYAIDVKDTAQLRFDSPMRHQALGEIALAEGRGNEAIDEFRKGDIAGDALPIPCGSCVMILLARAFDGAKMADSAIAEYERFVSTTNRSIEIDALWRTRAEQRLGELYESKGLNDRAAAHYAKFVELWKNADPEFQPRVAEVRRRIAKLTPVEGRRR